MESGGGEGNNSSELNSGSTEQKVQNNSKGKFFYDTNSGKAFQIPFDIHVVC